MKTSEAQKTLDSYLRYISLSKCLFAEGDKGIYNINELPKEHEFYKPAMKMAKDLEISWKSMTHEESNRIMLALLEDFYLDMAKNTENKKNLVLTVNVKEIKPK